MERMARVGFVPGVATGARRGAARQARRSDCSVCGRGRAGFRLAVGGRAGGLDPDDQAPNPSEFNPEELTLEQQLVLKSYKDQIRRMPKEEAQSLAKEVVRQMVVKDNIIRKMTKGKGPPLNVEPLDPQGFLSDQKGDGSDGEAQDQ